MTVAVVGPGAVGGALAVRMASTGEDVICIARPEAAAAIAANGLTLEADGHETSLAIDAREKLDEPVDLLIVAVKAMGLDDAIARITSEPRLVLPLLNGLEHMAVLRDRFSRVVAATIGRFEGHRETTTRIVQLTPGVVNVAAGEAPDELERGKIATHAGGSEADVLWEKLARRPDRRAHVGHRLDHRRAQVGLGAPPGSRRGERSCRRGRRAHHVRRAVGRCRVAAGLGHVLDGADVLAGNPSELDAIGGAVVRAGERLGVPTPVLEEAMAACPV